MVWMFCPKSSVFMGTHPFILNWKHTSVFSSVRWQECTKWTLTSPPVKIVVLGVPGWLSWLSVQRWLRSISHGLWVGAPPRALCCQRRVHFVSSVPHPLCSTPTLSLSLSKIKIKIKIKIKHLKNYSFGYSDVLCLFRGQCRKAMLLKTPKCLLIAGPLEMYEAVRGLEISLAQSRKKMHYVLLLVVRDFRLCLFPLVITVCRRWRERRNIYNRVWQTFSVKDQIVNILDFVSIWSLL